MSQFLLTGLPMPPSVNDQYMPFGFRMGNGKITARINPTKHLTKFQKDCDAWAEENFLVVGKARVKAQEMLATGGMLEVTTFAVFPSTLIWCKNAGPRKMDVSNRMKALEDSVAKMLLIDDSYFFKVSAEKVERMRIDIAFCAVLIRPWKPRSVAEVKEQERL